jgi:hypothetical protein
MSSTSKYLWALHVSPSFHTYGKTLYENLLRDKKYFCIPLRIEEELVEEQGTSGSQAAVPTRTMGDSFVLRNRSYLSILITIV